MKIPLFDQNQAQIAKARFELEEATKRHSAVELKARQEVRGAYRRAAVEWETAAFYCTEVLPQREENLALSREAYREGKTAFLSVLEAQEQFLEARREFLIRRRNSALVIPEIERAVGQPLSKVLEEMTRERKDAGEGEGQGEER